MAKRVAQKIKSVQSATQPKKTAQLKGWSGYLKNFISAPATLYVAGGIGVAVLARFAYKYYNSHPEFSDYIRDNFESVESKLKEYKNSLASSDMDEAQH